MINEVTLQINISPGDVNYADLTVPALVANHPDIEKRLLIVDCCRPQKTKLVNPDQKFPIRIFNEKVRRITDISKNLLKNRIVTEVYYLLPNDPIYKELSKKYLSSVYDCTHAAGGTANMSYWAGIELVKTKYVLHYDGDIILHQKDGYSWVNEALTHMAQEERIIFSVPRLSPPIDSSDLPSLNEGRPLISLENYWLNDWFSTRHFLLNKARLNDYLPLVRGKVKLELLVRKYGKRAFPIDPEILLFRSLGSRGCKRLMLKNEGAWLIHPADKSDRFIKIIKDLITEVSKGNYPTQQSGYENINIDAWVKFLQNRDE